MTGSEQLDYLDRLMTRKEFQGSGRPEEPASSDMHFASNRRARRGIGSHQSAAALKDEWLTPPTLIKALGVFDLDPCAPVNRPWDTAKQHYTIMDDGLTRPWAGRVWCNPPYGAHAAKWLARCAAHGNAVALIFARTETAMFFEHVWGRADAVLFLRGRLHFHHIDGTRARANGGAPSVLIAYGRNNAHCFMQCGVDGQYIDLCRGQNATHPDPGRNSPNYQSNAVHRPNQAAPADGH